MMPLALIAEKSADLTFDWTVNLGQIGIIATFLVGVGGWIAQQRALGLSQKQFEERVDKRLQKIEERMETQQDILVAIARQEVRLDANDERMTGFDRRIQQLLDELSHMRSSTVFIPPRLGNVT